MVYVEPLGFKAATLIVPLPPVSERTMLNVLSVNVCTSNAHPVLMVRLAQFAVAVILTKCAFSIITMLLGPGKLTPATAPAGSAAPPDVYDHVVFELHVAYAPDVPAIL